ncbi:MAG: hypothetical protein WDZ85_02860 [Candidatus Paceibacterota bacterium]
MLLGIKTWREVFRRHLIVGSSAGILVWLFYLSRPALPGDIALGRALGDVGFILLCLTLAVGPLSRLYLPALRLVSWRRETGIWFFVLALGHALRLFKFALAEPGLALSNMLGLTALILAFFLAATSSDWAVNFLGISSWKWLHQSAYTIFYLVSLHAAYFLFFRYPEATNWFRWPFLFLVVTVLSLQIAAFIKTVSQQKTKNWY